MTTPMESRGFMLTGKLHLCTLGSSSHHRHPGTHGTHYRVPTGKYKYRSSIGTDPLRTLDMVSVANLIPK